MPGYTMPFPGRELAMRELTYDPCYEKIPEEDRAGIVDAAWKKGEAAMVMDREEIILDIFARRARTREAVLQVDLAVAVMHGRPE